MLLLMLGVGAVLLLWGGLSAFAQADIRSLKALGAWVVGIGGLVLAVLLVLSGRGATALFALTLLGPAAWNWWKQQGSSRASTPSAPPRSGAMTRTEALAVLGLAQGASAAEIKAAHLRLMRAAHPDNGGSDWIASRINQARDLLLGG